MLCISPILDYCYDDDEEEDDDRDYWAFILTLADFEPQNTKL